MSDQVPCPICRDPEHECWGTYDGYPLDTYIDGDFDKRVICPKFVAVLLADIEAIRTVEQLRDCIIRYCEPHPTGGILHLTLEEEGYTDEIIRRQIDWHQKDAEIDALGMALARKLLEFTPEQRAYANRWETG